MQDSSSNHHKTWIDNELLNSKAWHSLGGKAPHVLLHFYQRRKMKKKRSKQWECINENELTFTYGEALAKGITQRAFVAAIDALIGAGFVDIVTPGGGTECRSTVYALSGRWKRYGTDAFVSTVRSKHHRGYCSKKNP